MVKLSIANLLKIIKQKIAYNYYKFISRRPFMKFLKFTLLILIISTFTIAQNVSVGDYEVPVSTAKILRLNGSYNWGQTTTDSSTVVTANAASATIFLRSFYSSLPYAWFIDVDATGGKSFNDYTHDVSIRPSIRKYIWNNRDWFGTAALDVRHRNDFKQLESNLLIGAGYGRYINATALAKAVRIEEHLINENVISDHLPKETMIKIANIIEREDEYKGIYGDTYEKEWYEAIEKEIKDSGYLNGTSLGAIGILRTQQVLKAINEKVNDRFYGWDATLGFLFNLSTRDKSPTRSPALALGGRYSHPIGWRSQINTFANVNTPLDSSFFKLIIGAFGLDYLYELSNKINFISGYNLNFTKPIVGDAFADHNFTASFVFYLENQINLGINASVTRSGLTKQTDLGSSVTLQYNFF